MSRWKKCKVETCARPAWKKGLCGAHHGRLVRGGDLRPEVPIKWRPSGYKKLTISVNNGNNGNPKS